MTDFDEIELRTKLNDQMEALCGGMEGVKKLLPFIAQLLLAHGGVDGLLSKKLVPADTFPDMSKYVLKDQVPDMSNYIPKNDSGYQIYLNIVEEMKKHSTWEVSEVPLIIQYFFYLLLFPQVASKGVLERMASQEYRADGVFSPDEKLQAASLTGAEKVVAGVLGISDRLKGPEGQKALQQIKEEERAKAGKIVDGINNFFDNLFGGGSKEPSPPKPDGGKKAPPEKK